MPQSRETSDLEPSVSPSEEPKKKLEVMVDDERRQRERKEEERRRRRGARAEVEERDNMLIVRVSEKDKGALCLYGKKR